MAPALPGPVCVTAASGGIGLTLCRELLDGGYTVFAHYRSNRAALDALAAELPGRLTPLQADLARPDDVEALERRLADEAPDLYGLVHGAAHYVAADDIVAFPRQDLETTMQVNVYAAFRLSQGVFARMRERGEGRIVFTSSIGVKYGGSPHTAPYTFSKAAVEAMSMGFAKAGAPHGVLVNALRVGVTDTGMHDANPHKDMQARLKLIPLGRAARPREVCRAVLFLLDPANSYTTGTVLTVAGGE